MPAMTAADMTMNDRNLRTYQKTDALEAMLLEWTGQLAALGKTAAIDASRTTRVQLTGRELRRDPAPIIAEVIHADSAQHRISGDDDE